MASSDRRLGPGARPAATRRSRQTGRRDATRSGRSKKRARRGRKVAPSVTKATARYSKSARDGSVPEEARPAAIRGEKTGRWDCQDPPSPPNNRDLAGTFQRRNDALFFLGEGARETPFPSMLAWVVEALAMKATR
jgi:hypothetical protein